MQLQDGLGVAFSQKKTPEQIQHILTLLREPFDEEAIKWKPQMISYKDKDNPKGQAAAYADPRAYSDRLNEVVGPDGWFELCTVAYSVPFPKKMSKRNEEEKYVDVIKMTATVGVGIIGLGFHTNVGESWCDDENAYTISYAQALKRACYPFGLGRYLYDLPKIWHPVDKYGHFKGDGPAMPDWAKPRKLCSVCTKAVEAVTVGEKTFTISRLVEHSKGKYGRIMCAGCMNNEGKKQAASIGNRVGADEQQQAA